MSSVIERFFELVAGLLGWLYSLTNSYGLAIILLTVFVMLLITPLNLKSTRSMLEMQRLQPELRRIQTQYKDDRERQQQEMMAFYKEHNINPLGGCLPMVLQAPIFLILYRVLRGITERNGGYGSGVGHFVGQTKMQVPLTNWRLTDQVFDPQHLNKSSEMYRSLASTTKMQFLGVDLSLSPLEALRIGVLTAIPFMLLMAGMLVSQIIQNRQIQGRNPNGNINPQQQMMMKVLPFMLPVFSVGFPAGLGVYYFVQGLCRIGLQKYITGRFYGEGGLGHEVNAVQRAAKDAKDEEKKSGKAIDTTSSEGRSGNGKSSGTAANGNGKRTAAATAKPPTSPKAVALQKKTTGGTQQQGRRSGTPRSRSFPTNGGDNPNNPNNEN